MRSTSRLFNYFFSKAEIDYQPLGEVIVEGVEGVEDAKEMTAEKNEIDDIQRIKEISPPFKVVKHTSAHKWMYFEIKECLTLLEQIPSFHEKLECRRKFCHFFSWVCLISTPSLAFAFMYQIHAKLAAALQKQLEPLFLQLAKITSDQNILKQWYDNELKQVGPNARQLDMAMNCYDRHSIDLREALKYVNANENIFDEDCREFDISYTSRFSCEPYQYPNTFYRDYCTAAQMQSSPWSDCNEIIAIYCEEQKAFFSCMNGIDAEIDANKNILTNAYSANMTVLNAEIDSVNISMATLRSQNSTWEPGTTTLFALTSTMGVGYLLFRYIKLRNAIAAHERDLTQPVHLVFTKSHSLLRILNLIHHLNIPFDSIEEKENLTVAKLMAELKCQALKYLPEANEMAFLSIAHQYKIPRDLYREIIKHKRIIEAADVNGYLLNRKI